MATNDPAGASDTTGADYATGAGEHTASETTADSAGQSPQEEPSIKQRAQRVAEEQKSATAGRVSGIAHATDRAAEELAREVPQAAEALHSVAQRLDSAASALRERSIDEWIDGARSFARKQPLAFFAGAVATGFALSRFLKSSSPEPHGHG